MTEEQIDQLMTLIGAEIPDTPEAWSRVAMACLDQGMISCGVQDRIVVELRRAGVDPEAR